MTVEDVTFMIKWSKAFISIWRTYWTSVPITTPLPLPQRCTTILWYGMHAKNESDLQHRLALRVA
jgi:hypothetical protein